MQSVAIAQVENQGFEGMLKKLTDSFNHVLLGLALICLLVSGLAPRSEAFQFINQITRPCATGNVPLANVTVNPNNSGNINAAPCQGGSFTVNGVPVGSGSVTSIATTSPITGGPITATGTIGCATCVTSAAALTANRLIIGAGLQAEQVLGSLGTTTTVLHGNAAGAPTFGAVSLTADVSGDLPFSSFVPATAASKLVGRGSAGGAGDFQEITLGSGLTMTGTTLSASGGITNSAGANVIAKSDGTNLVASRITDGGTDGSNIEVDSQSGQVIIGDINGFGNSTLLTINDPSSQIELRGTLVTNAVVPQSAIGYFIGSTTLPFNSLYIGAAATNNIQLTGTATGARTATLPDATGIVGVLNTGTATLNFGNLAAIGCEDLTVTVTGAALSDTVALGVPNASVVANGFYTAWVSSANTVTIRFCTVISGDPASGSFKVDVFKH